jgi:hypothetical protein
MKIKLSYFLILFLALSSVSMMGTVAPVSAGKPINFREPFYAEEWVADFDGFEVWWRGEGKSVVHMFEDRMILNAVIDVTYWSQLPNDGAVGPPIKSLSGRSAGANIIYFEDVTIAMVGLFFRARTSEGELILDAGKIVVDLITGEVVEMHGPHPLSDEYFADQLGVLLAPDD